LGDAGAEQGRRRREGRQAHQRDAQGLRAEALGFVVAAVLPPLLLEGYLASTTLATAIIGAILCAAVLAARGDPAWPRPPPLVALAIGAIALTALQLVPLPAWMLRLLTTGSSPPMPLAHAELTARLLDRPAPTLVAISCAPADTRHALVTAGAVLAFAVAASVTVEHGRRRTVLSAVAASTIGIAVVTVAHVIVRAERVYGLFMPVEGTAMVVVSPLMNENHLGGFLAMGVPLCIGLALSSAEAWSRRAWLAAALFDALVGLGAFSRGGLLGLIVGVVALVLLTIARRTRSGAGSRAQIALAVGAVVFALGLAGYAWYEPLSRDLGSTTLDKVRIAIRGLDLVARNPWLGVGRGGYSAAFVGLLGTDVRHGFAENFLVQWAADWGLPFALASVGILAVVLVRAVRSARSIDRLSAIAALIGLAAHELVDFATEMPGILVVTALLAVGALADRRHRRATKGGVVTPWVAAPVLTLALVVFPGTSLLGDSVDEQQQRIETAIESRSWGDAERMVADGLEGRPGEPVLVLLGAYVRVATDDRSALRWLNAAMALAPHWSSPHVLAAEWLASRGAREQAWLEIREAERTEPARAVAAACSFAQSDGDGERAVRLFSEEPDGPVFLESMIDVCSTMPLEPRRIIDQELLARGVPAARRRAAQQALVDGDAHAALQLLEGITLDQDPLGVLVRADALVRVGRASDAVALLEQFHGTTVPRARVLEQLARARAAEGDVAATHAVIQQLQGEAHGDAAAIADALMLLAELDAQLGDRPAAYAAYDRAQTVDPSRGALGRAYDLAQRSGDAHRADALRLRLCGGATATDPACTHAAP
jgi:hypothetical protein